MAELLLDGKDACLLLLEVIQADVCRFSALKDIQIIYIARLLHIFEYLIKNLYDAPVSLVDQVGPFVLSPGISPTATCPPEPAVHYRCQHFRYQGCPIANITCSSVFLFVCAVRRIFSRGATKPQMIDQGEV